MSANRPTRSISCLSEILHLQPRDSDPMTKRSFQLLFMVGPVVFGFLIPLYLGLSNLIWGSILGIGLCLGAFADGGLFLDSRDHWGRIGFFFDLLTPVLIFLLSGWLWSVLSVRGRNYSVIALCGSFIAVAPIMAFQWLADRGIHLPDLSLHLASAY